MNQNNSFNQCFIIMNEIHVQGSKIADSCTVSLTLYLTEEVAKMRKDLQHYPQQVFLFLQEIQCDSWGVSESK